MILALALLACNEPEQLTVGGRTGSLTVNLLNPTSCERCDPWAGVAQVRVDVIAGKDLVSQATFDKDEPIVLPDLSGFGVVRVQVLGLSVEGAVRSAGRTAEVALGPDVAAEAPLVFLPVNRALPLAARMQAPRSRHAAIALRDGRVALVGGEDPGRTRTLPTIEVYDPATGTFTTLEQGLGSGVIEPALVTVDAGNVLLLGGGARIRAGEVSVKDAVLFDIDDATATPIADLNVARSGHCAARWKERQAIVLGGAAGDVADYVKPSDGDWVIDAVPMRDFDPSQVRGCVPVANERVLVLGADLDTTGIWAPVEGGDPGASFTAFTRTQAQGLRLVERAMMVPLPEGGAWIAGGLDVATGNALPGSRFFDAAGDRFTEGRTLAQPRVDGRWTWWRDGVLVVGCGYGDAARTTGSGPLEIMDLRGSGPIPTLALDRARPGCALSTLPDGTLLVTGGFGSDQATEASAALLQPWRDEDDAFGEDATTVDTGG